MATSDMTASTVSEIGQSAPQRRAAQTTAKTRNTGNSPVLWMIFVIVALAFGIGIGTFFTRRHYKAKEVVVSVNGTIISKGRLDERIEALSGPSALASMVDDELYVQFAKNKGVAPTETEVEAEYKKVSNEPDFQARLTSRRLTAAEAKMQLRATLAQAAVVKKGVTVTDADIQQFYKMNTDKKNLAAQYYTPETVVIAAIITPTEAEIKKAQSDLGKGIPFATVTKNYSKDNRSKANGGVMPPIMRGRTAARQVAGLEQAVFGMKIGETSAPKKFAKSWWLVRCLDKKLETTKPFETVKEECRTGAMLQKGLPENYKTLQAEFAEFRKKANIQVFLPQYKTLFDKR